ncbi:MAG: 50S ribosomal protein L22 [bacterium]
MDFRASVLFLKIAPRKVRLVAEQIKGLSVPSALAQLNVSIKISARPIRKLVSSAVAGAKAQEKKAEDLFIKSIYVNEGPKLKRYRPRAFGRASEILKRSSHITLILTDKKEDKKSDKLSKSKSKIKAKTVKEVVKSDRTAKKEPKKVELAKSTKPAKPAKK